MNKNCKSDRSPHPLEHRLGHKSRVQPEVHTVHYNKKSMDALVNSNMGTFIHLLISFQHKSCIHWTNN